MRVERIEYEDTKGFILNKHYAQRMPSVTWAYGLYQNDELVGVLTVGKPASNSLCVGLMGNEYSKQVYELNRLITVDGLEKNTLSWFVARVLKMLKEEDLILVSYADDGVGHKGYIYQATNWLYLGKTQDRTDKYTPGGKHSRHYNNEYDHLRKYRTSKHRYVYFTDKRREKEYKSKLNYEICDYPKGDNQKYVLGQRAKQKIINTITGREYYE